MLTYYHASRELVEHPALLVDSLHRCGATFQSSRMLRSDGSMAGVEFCLLFHPKRFRANLSVAVKWNGYRQPYPKILDEASVREYLAGIKSEHLTISQFETRMTEALATLGITVVDSRVGAEIDFVTQQFASHPDITKLIQALRERQSLIGSAVDLEDFELAFKHGVQRDRLLDELYVFCSTRL